MADDQPATEGHEGSKGNIYIGKLHFEKGHKESSKTKGWWRVEGGRLRVEVEEWWS